MGTQRRKVGGLPLKAAVATEGSVRVETVSDPVPRHNQLLVAPQANGICGSDLRLLKATSTSDPNAEPLILGHELCGRVLDYGTGVSASTRATFPEGCLVCVNPFVTDRDVIGLSPRFPGGMAELAVLDTDRLLRVPDHVPSEQAALAEPLAVGVRAANVAIRHAAHGPFLVVGCGPIGLAVIVALRYSGFGPIIASDLSEVRRSMAVQLGADKVVEADTDSPFNHLQTTGFAPPRSSPMLGDVVENSEPGLVVFECTGKAFVIEQIVEAAPRHTHLVIVGVSHDPITIIPAMAIAKELTMDFVLAYRHSDLKDSLHRIASDSARFAPLITATVSLARAAWAIDALRHGDHGKVLVLPYTDESSDPPSTTHEQAYDHDQRS